MITRLISITKQVSTIVVVVLSIVLMVAPLQAIAMSKEQKRIFSLGIGYFDNERGCSDSGSSPEPTGDGSGGGSANIFILGDSITSLSSDTYKSVLGGAGASVTIDSSFDRGVDRPGNPSLGKAVNPGTNTGSMTGMQAIQKDQVQIKAANKIVIALGTNAGLTNAQVDKVINAVKKINKNAQLFWVDTVITDGDHSRDAGRLNWVNQANKAIYAKASADGYSIISWAKTFNSKADPPRPIPGNLSDPNGYMSAYHVHPNDKGIKALVNLVKGKVLAGSTSSSESSSSSSSMCCGSGGSSGGTSSDASSSQIKAFAHESITSTWGITDSTVEQWFLKQAGARATVSKYGLNSSTIKEITATVKAAGVSPVFFYAYTVNEGGGSGGFINHYSSDAPGGGIANAARDAEYLASQSKKMSGTPSWIDAGNPVDFVPQDVKTAGDADFKSMPAGTIGRAYIPATAAATWEVYYPNGLKKEYNKVQNYGSPLNDTMKNIQKMGGDPMQGGAISGGCSGAGSVTGEGMAKAISWAKMIANNDGYGYDQNTRTTGWKKWKSDPSCTDQCGSFDCSSFISAALTEAGYFSTNPNFNTLSEVAALQQAGFTKVAASGATSEGLQAGDILISSGHTAMYIGNNQIVDASHNENGGINGGKTGDQTGEEIRIHTYYNGHWNLGIWRASK